MAGMADITCRLWNRLVSFNRRFINLYTKFTQSIARNRCTGSEEGSYIDSKTGGWIRSTELSGSCNRTEARSLPGDCLQKWKSLIVETFVKANVFFSFFFFFRLSFSQVEKQVFTKVEKKVPTPIEKIIPVKIEKPVPFHVVKHVPVPVVKPIPIKIPIYKTVVHSHKGH